MLYLNPELDPAIPQYIFVDADGNDYFLHKDKTFVLKHSA